jgi:RHS repeat-associated protein
VLSSSTGTLDSSMKFFPFGVCLQSPPYHTDKLFTGQRLDSTGLYYYGARYYDPNIGRFMSPDSIVQSPNNPQTLNRYSYCINNPLKYVDPSGQVVEINGYDASQIYSMINWDYDIWAYVSQSMNSNTLGLSYEWYNYQKSNSDVAQALVQSNFTFGWGGTVNNTIVGNAALITYNAAMGPAPIYMVTKSNFTGKALDSNGLGGISLAPLGSFVDITAWNPNDIPKIAVHEATHFAEQNVFGLSWFVAYYGEIGAKYLYYGGNYYTGAYTASSFEQRANNYSSLPAGKPHTPCGLIVKISDWLKTINSRMNFRMIY